MDLHIFKTFNTLGEVKSIEKILKIFKQPLPKIEDGSPEDGYFVMLVKHLFFEKGYIQLILG